MEGRFRQLATGLLALPISALPFFAYGTLTAEGRLVRDKLEVSLSPPQLPALTAGQVGAAGAAAPRYRGRVMALAYHGVGSTSDGEGGFVVSPRRFGEHLATLRAAGMKTVTAADVAEAFATGRPVPENAVMISFDDGRADALLYADPLLKEAGMQATIFVISSAAERPGIYYAGWDRLRRRPVRDAGTSRPTPTTPITTSRWPVAIACRCSRAWRQGNRCRSIGPASGRTSIATTPPSRRRWAGGPWPSPIPSAPPASTAPTTRASATSCGRRWDGAT